MTDKQPWTDPQIHTTPRPGADPPPPPEPEPKEEEK